MCTEWSFTSGSQSAATALLRNEQRKSPFYGKKQKRPVLVALRVGDDAAVLLSEEKQRPF